MNDTPAIDAAKAVARATLADIKRFAEPKMGRAVYAKVAMSTVASSHCDPQPADAPIEAAEQGDPIAKQGVHQAIMWYVSNGDPLPERLRKYLADLLLLRDYGPKKRAGHKNYLRDRYIQIAVGDVCLFGLKPTRNPASEVPCGCSIVRDVLAEYGVHVSEKTVERILNKSAKLSRTT